MVLVDFGVPDSEARWRGAGAHHVVHARMVDRIDGGETW